MKPRNAPRRQVFVLTPEEKRAAACVVGAFLLGLGTMQYRSKHPRPETAQTAKEQRAAKAKAAKSPRPSAARAEATAPDTHGDE
jgi:hypothetical protein